MRVVCAPDSLKGVLSAPAAARALSSGVLAGGLDALEVPLADGGEGTAGVLQAAWGGDWCPASIIDPLGRQISARFLFVADRGLAIVESAEAIGLPLLGEDELDPMRASSAGLAHLILAAVHAGARDLVVTLGGSATVDGGRGFLEELPPDALASHNMTVLCDVNNTLHGPRGAARAFGPQKGADSDQVDELERRLRAMSELDPFADAPGAGAAGGLGAALASVGARLAPGASAVLDAVEFSASIQDAALTITGEGAVDATSLEGKVPAAVAVACRAAEVPLIVFGGRVTEDGRRLYQLGATAVLPLSGDIERAASDLEQLGFAAARMVRALRCLGG